MQNAIGQYFQTLSERFGDGWNRFWLAPSDPYILGPIRLLTGLILLYLHATLSPDLVRFFGAGGWIPVEAVRQLEGGSTPLSYLNFLSTPSELWIAHALGGLVLLLFTLGLFTRATSLLSLVVFLSNVHRGPMLTSQVEPIASFVLAYLCIGPAGASFSLDALRARRQPANPARQLSTAATISVRLIQVHTAIVYAVMALSQLMGDTWWLGMGIWWLITRPDTRLVDLTRLDAYLLQLWSHVTVVFELAFALLIWHRLARPLLLAIGVLMWGLLALASGLIPFALMMLVANLAFVSSEAMRSCCARCLIAKRSEPSPAVVNTGH